MAKITKKLTAPRNPSKGTGADVPPVNSNSAAIEAMAATFAKDLRSMKANDEASARVMQHACMTFLALSDAEWFRAGSVNHAELALKIDRTSKDANANMTWICERMFHEKPAGFELDKDDEKRYTSAQIDKLNAWNALYKKLQRTIELARAVRVSGATWDEERALYIVPAAFMLPKDAEGNTEKTFALDGSARILKKGTGFVRFTCSAAQLKKIATPNAPRGAKKKTDAAKDVGAAQSPANIFNTIGDVQLKSDKPAFGTQEKPTIVYNALVGCLRQLAVHYSELMLRVVKDEEKRKTAEAKEKADKAKRNGNGNRKSA